MNFVHDFQTRKEYLDRFFATDLGANRIPISGTGFMAWHHSGQHPVAALQRCRVLCQPLQKVAMMRKSLFKGRGPAILLFNFVFSA